MKSIVPATVVADGEVILADDMMVIGDKRIRLSEKDIALMLVYYAGILRYRVSERIRDLLERKYPEVYEKLDMALEEAGQPKVYSSIGNALMDCDLLATRVANLSEEIENLDAKYEELNEINDALGKLIGVLQRYDPSLKAVDTHVIWG